MIRLIASSPLVRDASAPGGVPCRPEPDPELPALRLEVQRLRLALALSRAREQRSRHLALHDALTGLPNRLEFDHQSHRAVARHDNGGRAFALLYIDLDGFKSVNDRYGHDIGDELLKVIASRLAHAVRKGDSISRHGGDEFACLLSDVSTEAQASAIARKLQVAISAPSQVGPVVVSIDPSIGVALYPRDAPTVARLLTVADQAMRWAKQTCVGQVCYSRLPDEVRSSTVPGDASGRRAQLRPAAALPFDGDQGAGQAERRVRGPAAGGGQPAQAGQSRQSAPPA